MNKSFFAHWKPVFIEMMPLVDLNIKAFTRLPSSGRWWHVISYKAEHGKYCNCQTNTKMTKTMQNVIKVTEYFILWADIKGLSFV